jgi:diguanylate cyclase (GGDEF)-like protein
MNRIDSPHSAALLGEAFEQRVKLLLVDDQPVNIQALYQVFASDHQVLAATDGHKALDIAHKQQPDLVLLDVVMPGMDGFEVCRRLKLDPSTSDIPVIFLTASSDTESEEQGLDAGAVDFIAKPFNPKIVRARVKTHVTLKRQSDLLRQWVFLDGLTGIANRRLFDERLAVEWGRSRRLGTALSTLLIDVDHFKRFNDAMGHQQGDACLRLVARALDAGVSRPTDLVARYGGEEFVCLLSDTDEAGAAHLAETLRQRVHDDVQPQTLVAGWPQVTVSVGVGCIRPEAMQQSADLIRQADHNLYRAKQAGRNQVMYGPLPT